MSIDSCNLTLEVYFRILCRGILGILISIMFRDRIVLNGFPCTMHASPPRLLPQHFHYIPTHFARKMLSCADSGGASLTPFGANTVVHLIAGVTQVRSLRGLLACHINPRRFTARIDKALRKLFQKHALIKSKKIWAVEKHI